MVLTICRRYHDWEHFSSIRNLRGPHTGLPNIAETRPPADTEPESASLTAAKGPEKERKKEKADEKEKAEAKHYIASIEPGAPLKVKLKLPPSTCSEAEGDGEGAAGVDAEVDEDLTAKLPSTPSPISRPSSSPLLATPTSSPSTSVVLEGLGHKVKQKYPHVHHHRNSSRGGEELVFCIRQLTSYVVLCNRNALDMPTSKGVASSFFRARNRAPS